jgi:TetR/AcrR family transcriptional regulator
VLTYNREVPDVRTATHRLPAVDRRRQLLETALDLFSRKGFEGTTTKEVATAAGVTEAIIFRHFPSKQALYTAVLDYRHGSTEMQDLMTACKACMDRNDDAGLFKAIATKIIEGYRKDPRLQRALFFAALEGHEQGIAHHRQLSIPVFGVIKQYLLRRQSEGALLSYNADAILAGIAGMAAHYAILTEMFGFTVNLSDAETIEIFTNIFMTGIQSPKAIKKAKI